MVTIDSLYIEITNKCNLRCPYCFNDSKASNKDKMSIYLFQKLVNECLIMGINKITISGGEPLLHPNFFQFVDILNNNKIEFQLITNGTCFTREHIAFLKDKKCSVQLTLDGPTEIIHDKIRGQGTFYKNIWVIDQLKEINKDFVIRFNLSNDNKYDVLDAVSLVRAKSIKDFYFSYIKPIGRGKNHGDVSIDFLFDSLKIIKKKRVQYEFPQCLYGINIDVNDSCPFYSEGDVVYSPRITATGNVYPCSICDIPDFVIGNVEYQTLHEISNSTNFLDFLNLCKDRYSSVTECNSCLINRWCHRGCPVSAYIREANINATDGYCSLRKKIFYYVLDRSCQK